MTFRESETVELKSIVVDDIKKEIEKLLKISQTTCGRLLNRMINNGQLVQEGKGKNTHYRLS